MDSFGFRVGNYSSHCLHRYLLGNDHEHYETDVDKTIKISCLELAFRYSLYITVKQTKQTLYATQTFTKEPQESATNSASFMLGAWRSCAVDSGGPGPDYGNSS